MQLSTKTPPESQGSVIIEILLSYTIYFLITRPFEVVLCALGDDTSLWSNAPFLDILSFRFYCNITYLLKVFCCQVELRGYHIFGVLHVELIVIFLQKSNLSLRLSRYEWGLNNISFWLMVFILNYTFKSTYSWYCIKQS